MPAYKQRGRKGWILPVGVALLGLGLIRPAVAQQLASPSATRPQRQSLLTPDDRAAMRQIFWHRMQERLGLSDQQAADMRSLLDAQRTAMRANVQSLIVARKQLRRLLDQSTVDSAAVQAAVAEVKTRQDALFDGRLQVQLALRAKLTPQQWQQWQALRKTQGHRWMRHGRGFGAGAGVGM